MCYRAARQYILAGSEWRDAEASDLDPDFLGEVAREGVLLYLQDGARVPEALAGLRPYEEWLRAVEAELAECRAVLALPPVERQVAPGV